MPDSSFPHLSLIHKAQGPAKFPKPNIRGNVRAQTNKGNRTYHGGYLIGQFTEYTRNVSRQRESRREAGLPKVEAGVPFLLQIPDGDDGTLEFLSSKLGLELVAEYDEGFVIVSTEKLDLELVSNLANKFIDTVYGSGQMANILEVNPDPLSNERINRILEESLIPHWPFNDQQEYILDISIEIAPFNTPPGKPKGLRSNTRPERKEILEAEHARVCAEYWQHWDDTKSRREQEIENLVQHYGGKILTITDNSHLVEFPDSFSMRIRMNGQGFTDVIKTYPNLFEVTVPDEIKQPVGAGIGSATAEDEFTLHPPPENSPGICVIDSGIQENHRWLENVVLDQASHCFIPGEASNEVADYVQAGGHGTRVAGACLYPQSVPTAGDYEAIFWLLNARVLNNNNKLIEAIFPPDLLQQIVDRYKLLYGTRLYQHSIAAKAPCRTSRMSVWAAAIDYLSYQEDVLFFQATGNLPTAGIPTNPGILDHIAAGRDYPEYLEENSSRISNPAQSLQALTVGSISREYFEEGDKRSVTPPAHASAFTRTGFGMWNSIKPEVVEFGGDCLRDSGNPPALSLAPEVCPELVRSTLHGGPAIDRDTIGTSFAAPKVAHIGGVLESILPEHGTLLYRALIANSARWPAWAERGNPDERIQAVRSLGYGVPDLERASTNNDNRVTLITDTVHEVKAGEALIFGVPIPFEIRRPGEDFQIRIDVCLSYAAEPRRTRKSRRGYLGVWLDWKTSDRGENFDTFAARTVKDLESDDDSNDGNFYWALGGQSNHGATKEVARKNGTLQKDWTFAQSNELPDTFGVVVCGHKGWAQNDENATARFSLVVSFEVIGANVNIYEQIKTAVQAELEIQQQQRVTI
jgi:hypothetical protein